MDVSVKILIKKSQTFFLRCSVTCQWQTLCWMLVFYWTGLRPSTDPQIRRGTSGISFKNWPIFVRSVLASTHLLALMPKFYLDKDQAFGRNFRGSLTRLMCKFRPEKRFSLGSDSWGIFFDTWVLVLALSKHLTWFIFFDTCLARLLIVLSQTQTLTLRWMSL